MSEERKRVLQMLAESKITAEEADRLLGAMDGGAAPASTTTLPAPKKARYLRVLVDAEDPAQGPVKVNVRVPMQLLRAGVRLTALIPRSPATRSTPPCGRTACRSTSARSSRRTWRR